VITTLRVTGMSCNRCVGHVDRALRAVPGVTAVEVNLPEGTAKIDHAETATVDALMAAVVGAGYELVDPGTPR
jgi:copper chaperone CopZ